MTSRPALAQRRGQIQFRWWLHDRAEQDGASAESNRRRGFGCRDLGVDGRNWLDADAIERSQGNLPTHREIGARPHRGATATLSGRGAARAGGGRQRSEHRGQTVLTGYGDHRCANKNPHRAYYGMSIVPFGENGQIGVRVASAHPRRAERLRGNAVADSGRISRLVPSRLRGRRTPMAVDPSATNHCAARDLGRTLADCAYQFGPAETTPKP